MRVGADRAEAYRTLLETSPASLVVFDRDLRIELITGREMAASGADPSDYEGKLLGEVLPEGQTALLKPIYLSALEGRVRTLRYRAAGDGRDYELIVAPIRDGDGEIAAGMAASIEAGSSPVGREREREDWGLFRTAFEDAPIGVAVLSVDGSLIEANRRWAETVQRERGELRGMSLAGLAAPEDRDLVTAAVESTISEPARPLSLEVRIALPGGDAIHCQLGLSLTAGRGENPARLIAQLEDISARKRDEELLRWQAEHDPLTDLLNRRALEHELRHRITGGRRSTDAGAMLLLDLDGLKIVNDQFGHPAGDETLNNVGRALRAAVREDDPVGRVGGDEFAVLSDAHDDSVRRDLGERILQQVRELTTEQGIPVTASVGIAAIDGSVSHRELWRRADTALYAAKDAGGDSIVFWSPDLDSVPRLER